MQKTYILGRLTRLIISLKLKTATHMHLTFPCGTNISLDAEGNITTVRIRDHEYVHTLHYFVNIMVSLEEY